ncbi:MAG: peptidase S41, partial [Sphingobacteriaceae bacterium]
MRKAFILILIAFASLAQAQLPNTITAEQKVYGLSRFWQEVNYNLVYINRVDRKAWDSLYVAMIPAVQQTKSDYEYFHELQRFCAFLKDGHTNVYPPQAVNNLVLNTMFGDHRLFIAKVDGKAIITHVNLSTKAEIPIGSEIVLVNGMKTSEYIDRYVRPYIASSTEYVRDDRACELLLQGLTGQKFDLKLKTPTGNYISLSLTHGQTTEKEIYPAFEDTKLLDFKWYPNQTAYVALNSFGDQKIDSLFIAHLPELYQAKKLIIDLRQNGGGSTEIGVDIL